MDQYIPCTWFYRAYARRGPSRSHLGCFSVHLSSRSETPASLAKEVRTIGYPFPYHTHLILQAARRLVSHDSQDAGPPTVEWTGIYLLNWCLHLGWSVFPFYRAMIVSAVPSRSLSRGPITDGWLIWSYFRCRVGFVQGRYGSG